MQKKSQTTHRALSPARAAAFDILLRVGLESSYASDLLHSRTYAHLSPENHALATELVMGVLRWQSRLDSEIARVSTQPLTRLDFEVLTALRIALYQIRRLSRIPARAAIHESVELIKRARKSSAASFVNAVLRSLAGGSAQFSSQPIISNATVEALAATSAHPKWLVERWTRTYSIDIALQICQHNQSVPVTAVRLRRADAEQCLQSEGIELAPGAILASARRMVNGDITRTPAFRQGLCVIQDEASQLVAALVGHGRHILDCCAAPGGKTAAIADANPEAEIVATELHPHRTRLLRKLLGAGDSFACRPAHSFVIAADAQNLPFSTAFDRILADVPCSGTGTLSRNPEIKWRLKSEDLANLQERQLAILRSVMSHASYGGRIIYSTCSLEREENEDVIEHALHKDPSFRVVDCQGELDRLRKHGELIWQGHQLTQGPYLRTLPGVHPCDGFFAAIVEKS